MNPSYVWHNSSTHVSWPLHMCDTTPSYVRHDALICVTWLLHMCGMTPSYVWHDSCACTIWILHKCDVTLSYVCHGSLACVTWLVHMCKIAPTYAWHDSRYPCFNPCEIRCFVYFIYTVCILHNVYILTSEKCCRRSPSACGTVCTKHVHVSFIFNKTVSTH